MTNIVVAEIVVNVVSLFLMVSSLYVYISQASSPAANIVMVIEALIEIGQVVCSALALEQMEGSMQPVNQLLGSLIGKLSENNDLCVLPCCTKSGSQIAC